MSNHDCGLGKTQKRESSIPHVFFVDGSTKKVALKCLYLYEGRKKNDSLRIVSCIYVENIEIKTEKQRTSAAS